MILKYGVYLVARSKSKYVIAYLLGYKLIPVKIYGLFTNKLKSNIIDRSALKNCKIIRFYMARSSQAEQEQMIGALSQIIKYMESKYVDQINNATILNPLTKLHFYDRLRGIGPNTRTKILTQRKIKKFMNYVDFKERIGKNLELILFETIKYELYSAMTVEQRILTSICHV